MSTSNHFNLSSAYTVKKHKRDTSERFFVAYAVQGAINPETGVRQGMPSLYPIKNSPVTLPSPLNTRYQYIPKMKYNLMGIL